MALKLVFKKDNLLNTTIVDDKTGAVMYDIGTEGSFMNRTTIIRKPFTGLSLFRPTEPLPLTPSHGHLTSTLFR